MCAPRDQKKDPETTNVSGAEFNAILLDRRPSMELRIREHLTVVNAEVVPRRKLRLVSPFVRTLWTDQLHLA